MLSYASFVPQKADRAVVLFHGYGATGSDLIDAMTNVGALLPQTAFFAPNAPLEIFPGGYAWYPLEMGDESLAQIDYVRELTERAKAVVPTVEAFVDHICEQYHFTRDQVVLGGFSQGGLLALLAAYGQHKPFKGVMALSSIPLADPIENAPLVPALITHGSADQVVPPIAARVTEETLRQMNETVRVFFRADLGHGLDMACLKQIARFLNDVYE